MLTLEPETATCATCGAACGAAWVSSNGWFTVRYRGAVAVCCSPRCLVDWADAASAPATPEAAADEGTAPRGPQYLR